MESGAQVCQWKRTKVLVGVSFELVTLCSKRWGTSCVCPLLSQPSLGTGITPSSSEYSGVCARLGRRVSWEFVQPGEALLTPHCEGATCLPGSSARDSSPVQVSPCSLAPNLLWSCTLKVSPFLHFAFTSDVYYGSLFC